MSPVLAPRQTSTDTLRAQLLETAKAYLDNFNSPGADLAGVIALRTPDCVQRILPASLKAPPQTNQNYVAYNRRLRAIIHNFTLALSSDETPLVDVEARSVMLPVHSTGATDFGPYANEYLIVLSMTEEGTQIKKITEFIDTQYTREFLQNVGAMALTAGAA